MKAYRYSLVRSLGLLCLIGTGLASAGNSNYERSLADNFSFTPRDQDRLQFPDGTFDGWTKAVEMRS